MPADRDDLVFVRHILDAISKIQRYTTGMSWEDFSSDEKTQDSVTFSWCGRPSSATFRNCFTCFGPGNQTRQERLLDYRFGARPGAWRLAGPMAGQAAGLR